MSNEPCTCKMPAKKVAAGIVIFRKLSSNVEYLFLQTSYGKHHWTPPKGFVDPEDKSDLDTALRETEEESGLKRNDLTIFEDTKHTMQYVIPGNCLKTVHYWLAELVDCNKPVILSDEHRDFRWANLQEATRLGDYKEMKEMLFKYDEYIRTSLCNESK